MFACIFGRNTCRSPLPASENEPPLITLAFTFSPLIEHSRMDTVVLDISGQDLLFGAAEVTDISSARNVAHGIATRAAESNLEVSIAVAANPDAAIHAARAFEGTTVIGVGEELSRLGNLSIKRLDYSLAKVEAPRAAEIQETFALWGIHTFQDFALLPLKGVAERLGQEGVRLQELAQGRSDRRLELTRPPIGFEQSIELEHPIEDLEPLSFILSRLLNQLCANLHEHALATNELQLRLNLEDRSEHERTITLPVPMRNHKTLLRLLLFDIEVEPPQAAITKATIVARPVKPRASQTGLFIPLAPEPEKLEITLARLAKLVGADRVGSPEVLDTHRPDAFRIKRFSLPRAPKKRHANPPPAIQLEQCLTGFRVFRPPWHADVQTRHGQPARINARSAVSSARVRGKIVCASGPWRASGDWWRTDVWARDEWDVAVTDQGSGDNEVLCRIYRDLTNEQWFVAGIYD